MPRPPRRSLVRFAPALAAALLLASYTPGGSASGAAEEFVNGSGNGYAQLMRVGPTAARLSLAPIMGLSLADYLSTVGRGQATAADWAAVGIAEPELPKNTPYTKVESTQKDSEKGKTLTVGGGTDENGNGGGAMELYARATKAPYGESRARMERFGIPGFIEMDGAEARTHSGIVSIKGQKVRESKSVVDITGLTFAGVVELTGLRWEALQRTGGTKTVSGSFTIEGASIGPVPLDVPAGGAELETVLGPINAAIASTGFAIRSPKVEKTGGVAQVSPLQFEVVNSPLGRQFLAPILEAAQPIREPLTDALITGSGGEASIAILVADLTLGIFSGSSQLHMEFGGVHSFTEGEAFTNPFGPGGGFRPPDVGPSSTVVVPGQPGSAAVRGATSSKDGSTLVSGPLSDVAADRTLPGRKGGVAVAVGLIGMFFAAGLATRDYWKMRKHRQTELSA